MISSIFAGVSFSQRSQSPTNDYDEFLRENVLNSFIKNKDKKNYNPGKMMIKLKNPDDVSGIESEYGVLLRNFPGDNSALKSLTFDPAKNEVSGLMLSLNDDPRVVYAEPCYYVKLSGIPKEEPYQYNLWGLENTEYPGLDINISPVWSKLKNASEVVVGIIDSGIDYNHEDLKQSMWKNRGEIPGNRRDDDNNGYVDDIYGWNFSSGNNSPLDDFGHGTHVAGIIAAKSNNTGIVGVSPNVKLMALKFLKDDGYGDTENIAAAIVYGLKKGVKIFNCSYGSPTFTATEYEMMRANKNILFVAASGNDGLNNDKIKRSYPACYNLPNILTVASVNENGSFSGFSNYGPKSVEIAAPGGNIFSTRPNGKYDYDSGTSMAAPYVTSVAALCLAVNPSLEAPQIKYNILASKHFLHSLKGKVKTSALVDAASAIARSNKNYNIPVKSLMTSAQEINLIEGSSEIIKAKVVPANCTDGWIQFSSSNPSIARVSTGGTVTGLTPGEADITIKVGKFKKTCKVTVTSNQNLSFKAGDTVNLRFILPVKGGTGGIATFIKPYGQKMSVPVSCNKDTSLSTIKIKVAALSNIGSLEIDSTREYGKWEIEKVSMWNNNSHAYDFYLNKNYYNYTANHHIPFDFTPFTFKVVSPNGVDSTNNCCIDDSILNKNIVDSPVLENLTIDDTSYKSGSIIKISAKVKSNIGIDSGSVVMIGPSGDESSFQLETNPKLGYMYANIGIDKVSNEHTYINSKINSGAWKIKNVTICEIDKKTKSFPQNKDFTINGEVVNPNSISLSSNSVDLINSKSHHISAMFEPKNTTDKSLIWTSSNPSVATVDMRGVINSKGTGSCNIYARSKQNPHIYSIVKVHVSPADTTSISKIKGVISPRINDVYNTISFSVPHTAKRAKPKITMNYSGYWLFYDKINSNADKGTSVKVSPRTNLYFIKTYAENGDLSKTYKVKIYKYPPPKKKSKRA